MSSRKSVGILTAGAMLTMALIGPGLAQADTSVNEIESRWTSATPATIGNGVPSPLEVYVNSNGPQAEDGTQPNVTFTTTVTNGDITRLPRECSGPGSSVSANKRTLTCNVGTMKHGTAQRVTIDVVSNGLDKAKLGATSKIGNATATVPEKTITATRAADLQFDYDRTNYQVPNRDSKVYAQFPVAVNVPLNAEYLNGTVEFDVVFIDSGISGQVGVSGAIEPLIQNGSACQSMGQSGQDGWPAALPTDDDITCTVSKTSANVYHYVMSGFNTDPTKAQTRDNKGQALPADRKFLASTSLTFQSTSPFFTATSTAASVSAEVRNVSFTTVGGTKLADQIATNNREERAWVVGGTRAAAWSRNTPSEFSFDGRGQGQEWQINGNALTGERWNAYAFDSTNSGGVPAGAGQDLSVCTTVPRGFDPEFVFYNAPSNAVSIEYTTAATSRSFDCGQGTWSALSFATFSDADKLSYARMVWKSNATQDEAKEWSLQHLRSLPAGVNPTAVRITYTGASVQALNSMDMMNGNTHIAMIGRITATSGELWTYGSSKRGAETSYTTAAEYSASQNIKQAPSGEWTNPVADVIMPTAFRVTAAKSASPGSVQVNQEVTFTLTPGSESNTSTGRPTNVRDVLPAAFDYVAGSASVAPASVTKNSNGTTTLIWNNYRVPGQGGAPITFKAKANRVATVTNTVEVKKTSAAWTDTVFGEVAKASASVAVIDAGETNITKTVGSKTTATDGSNTWNIKVLNDDAKAQTVVDVIDILPYNGDGRGTKFEGTYSISSVKATGAGSATVYYTDRDPKMLRDDPTFVGTTGESYSNGSLGNPAAIWTTTKPAKVTAIRVVAGNLAVKATLNIDIAWDTDGNMPGDAYFNRAGAKATFTRLRMVNADNSATIAAPAQFRVNKELVGRPVVAPNRTVTYDIQVKSVNRTFGTSVKDYGGNGLTDIRIVEQNFGTVSETDPTVWNLGNMAAGQVASAKVIATIAADADLTKPLVNRFGRDCATGDVQANPDLDSDTDACDDTLITPDVVLKVNKDVTERGELKVGDTVTYKVTALNDGTDVAGDVVVTDEPIRGLENPTFVEGTQTQGEIVDGKWVLGDLASKQPQTITVTATVSADVDYKLDLVNDITIRNPVKPRTPSTGGASCVANTDGVGSDTDQCDSEPVHTETKPQVDKSEAVFDRESGVANWEITVRNDGPTIASGVVVTDLGGANIDPDTIEIVPTDDHGTADGGTWTIGLMNVGEVRTAKVTASIATGDDFDPDVHAFNRVVVVDDNHPTIPTECVVNTGDVTTDDDRCDEVEFTDERPQVDKAIQSFDRDSRTITYKVTVRNDGLFTAREVVMSDLGGRNIDPATIVVVEDTDATEPEPTDEPTETPVDEPTDEPSDEPADGEEPVVEAQPVWEIGSMQPGEVRTATVTAKLLGEAFDPALTAVNRVIVASESSPRDPANPECVVNTGDVETDDDQCDEVEFTQDKPQVDKEQTSYDHASRTVTYKVTVRNDGPFNAHNVVVDDMGGRSLVADSIKVSDPSKGEVAGAKWSVGEMEVGETQTAIFTGVLADDLDSSVTAINRVIVNSDESPRSDDPAAECEVNEGDVTTDGDQCDEVEFRKDMPQVDKAEPSYDRATGVLTYQVTVRNDGPMDATNVVVTDLGGKNIDPATIEVAKPSMGEATKAGWEVGTLKPGQVATATVTAKLLGSMVETDEAINRVIVTSDDSPRDPENPECVVNTGDVTTDDDQCDEVPFREDKPQVDKSVDSLDGDTVTYTVTVRNDGPMDATNVVVDDMGGAQLDKDTIQVSAPSMGSADGAKWTIERLNPGATATAKVTAKLVAGAKHDQDALNMVQVTSDGSPRDPSKECVVNTGDVTTDDDQCDIVPVDIPTPPVNDGGDGGDNGGGDGVDSGKPADAQWGVAGAGVGALLIIASLVTLGMAARRRA